LAWIKLLQQSGFRNPAILSLEYTLVPDAIYPTQLNQAVAAYRYAFSIMNDDSSHICVSGDSAGGTLVLSLILRLRDSKRLQKPGLAVLVSPWVTIDSDIHTNTRSDYLDASTLHHYGAQYLNKIAIPTEESLASPGSCRNLQVWKAASPTQGWIITWGGEEMLRTDISGLVNRLEKAGLQVLALEAKGGIHAWPVAALYLGESMERRLQGLQSLVQGIRERMVSQID
jgi:acetyl esterase/lipase